MLLSGALCKLSKVWERDTVWPSQAASQAFWPETFISNQAVLKPTLALAPGSWRKQKHSRGHRAGQTPVHLGLCTCSPAARARTQGPRPALECFGQQANKRHSVCHQSNTEFLCDFFLLVGTLTGTGVIFWDLCPSEFFRCLYIEVDLSCSGVAIVFGVACRRDSSNFL